MAPRLDLQTLLEGVLGTPNVYFQAPPNNQMIFPCIVYSFDNAKSEFADNLSYSYTRRYQVSYIDRNPDSPIPDVIAQMPLSSVRNMFTKDNLHHYVFNLYF